MKITVFLFFIVFTIGNTLKGQKIYQVMYANECDVKIMIVAEESQCDLRVFFVDDETKSVKPGCWFVCDFPDKAEKKIFFTEDENEADIKILIIESESDAGWVNEEKKGKL